MKRVLQILITSIISMLFLSVAVHIDAHLHHHNSESSLCNIDSDSQKHHSFSHQCEKCLNKIQRICISTSFDLSIDEKISAHTTSSTIIYDKSIIYDLHSRPPPNLS